MKEHQAGQVVFGRYELARPLARGGMSSLWVAMDRKLKRDVAVKLMSPDYAASEISRLRFEREAMSVAKLQSPHIVQIFDYGVDDRTPFIVMELLVGEDLRLRLKREKRLPLVHVGRILAQAALGLSEAHAVGIVHRDLKPGNIFLARSRSGELVKILDFGVAKEAAAIAVADDELTEQGKLVGTPQYMSPEQVRCLPQIDFRSDLFSLGVIVYRALTGKLPFEGKTPSDLGVNICASNYVPATELVPELSPGVDDFIRLALGKEPPDRFQSAREMAEAFASLAPASQQGLLAQPGSLSDPGAYVDTPSQKGSIPPSSGTWSSPGAITGPSASSAPRFSSPSLGGSQPSASQSFPSAADGLLATSHSNTLVTALLEEASRTPRPSDRWRHIAIAALAALALGVAVVVGTIVGTSAAPDPTPPMAAPAGAGDGVAPVGTEAPAPDPEPTGKGVASAAASTSAAAAASSSSVASTKPKRSTAKPVEDDPFKQRK